MDSWSLVSSAARPEQRVLARLVSGIGMAGFAQAALEGLGGLFAIGSWSVYELLAGRPPRLHLSASRQAVDSTGDCFATYRDTGLYRRDRSFDMARHAASSGDAVMLKTRACDLPGPHRDAIYRRHAILERLSVAQPLPGGGVLAVNLYRHEGQGSFSAADTEGFASTALPLIATVDRHLACRADGAAEHGPAGAAAWLPRHCPGLTPRELQVLELLLRGLTYDGIAAQMALGVGTVKTYRARAFDRLGIHFKNELFALALAQGPAARPARA